MLRQRVNGHDMAYLEIGQGDPLVLIHGSLCDFRIWSPVLGPLSDGRRVIAPSLRHYFPDRWDGKDGRFTMDQHVADTIAFLEAIGCPADLVGHSRGGHIAFRVAEMRPDLIRRLVLAEPSGSLDPSLESPDAAPGAPSTHTASAMGKIAAGDLDGGLEVFIDAIEGEGVWGRLPATAKQEFRDNGRTLLGQVNEARRPYSRADAESIQQPTLLIGGGSTKGIFPVITGALAAHIPDVRVEIIPDTTHFMFGQAPVRFSTVVRAFLDAT